MNVGDKVWKEGGPNGYSGPGIIVAKFKNFAGQDRYVVAHVIAGGRGEFMHIYSEKEIRRERGAA